MTVLTALESSFTTDKDRSKDIQSDLELRSYFATYQKLVKGIDVNWNNETNIYLPCPFGKKSDNQYPYRP